MTLRNIILAGVIASGAVVAPAAVLFPIDTSWKHLKGTAEASAPDTTAWRSAGFDDSIWPAGAAPFFYGEALSGTPLDDMRGNYTCLFLRRTFVVNNPGNLSELEFSAVSDDGFIAWINGIEVARYNMPSGDVPYNGLSLAALAEPIPVETYTLKNPGAYLVPGTNVFAIQGFNCSLNNSSDFVFCGSLSAVIDVTPPEVATMIPPANALVRSLDQIEVGFSEGVTNVDAADLLVNGQATTRVTVFSASQYVFEFPPPATGQVQVAWNPNHGIRDLAANPNPFGGESWTYQLDPNSQPPGVVLNEFLAWNDKGIHDEDGDSSDWIELHNKSSATVGLNGWHLTDDTNNAAKWRFPNVALPANGYLLVFASGKNRTNATARLHTNFQLNRDSGYVALLDEQGNAVSDFGPAYPAQYRDVAYGRDRANPGLFEYFTTPTPGAANSTGGPGFAPEIEFSVSGGTFSSPFELVLTTAAANAVIRYSLGTNLPGASSPVYSNPIPVTATTLVRTRAFAAGLLPGPVRSESYIQLASGVLNFTSDLPIVILHNNGAGSVPASVRQLVMMEVFEPRDGRSSMTNAPDLVVQAGFHLRGSSTLNNSKGSFSLETWDEYRDDRAVSFAGLPSESDWVLYAPNNFEPVLIHNPFIHALSRQIGRYSPRTRFIEVYLNTSGGSIGQANYNGIYVLEEKIKTGRNRVDIDTLQPEHTQPPEVTGGYLLKVDRQGPNETAIYAGNLPMVVVEPPGTELDLPQRAPQRQYITDYFDALASVLASPDYANPNTGYARYADVDSWIDHHLLNVLAFNVDALRLSGYLFKPRNSKINMGPLWDFDRAMGSTDGRDSNPRIWRSTSPDYGTDFFNSAPIFSNPWYSRMFQDIDFWQRWIDRYQQLRNASFSNTNIDALIDSLANEVRQAQPREQTKWRVAPRGGSYQAEVNLMKTWFANRMNFMDTQFVAMPLPSRAGGPVDTGATLGFSAPAGATVFYTMDGTDPRLPGGGVAPRAAIYGSPIPLNSNARVVARTRNPTHRNLTGPNNPPLSSSWSAPVAATYFVSIPSLIVTEIMYHPAPPAPGDTNTADNFEFLELENTGQTTLNLTGFHFTNGIEYAFSAASSVTSLGPGQYALIVKNRAAFQSRYPGAHPIAGEYLGNLDNAGERLTLVGALEEPIVDVHYQNSWYPLTDGLGFSLVAANEQAPPNAWTYPAAWRASRGMDGSPGKADPPALNPPRVVINEAVTHPVAPDLDAIELCNASLDPADIGGWFLTDDFGAPKKFRIPNDVVISAGGFRVFTEADIRSGSTSPFALSSKGDAIYLFSGDAATNLTGYVHGFSFDAAEAGVSFGRYLNSLGREFFVPQAQTTLGVANSPPVAGPVVISEIMYHPAPRGATNNTLDEYIELRNIAANPIPMFHESLTNTWKIRGGVDYVFPTNLTLAAGACLLIVSFDPVVNPDILSAFRAKFKVDAGIRVLGPFAGNLNNNGENISLYRPNPSEVPPDPDANPPSYVWVDQVSYANVAPWPDQANGTGKSLQRLVDTSFGDDPLNWQTAAPTPGQSNAASGAVDTDDDGLPNAWELSHGLNPNDSSNDDGAEGDPDRDGMTNFQEYVSGTDPRDARSYLRVDSISAAGSSGRIRFMAVAGKTYSVYYQDHLLGGSWSKLTDVPAQTSTQPVEINDPDYRPAGTRFYRLVTPQSP